MRDYASLYQALRSDLDGELLAPDLGCLSDTSVRRAAQHCLGASFYKKLAPKGNQEKADLAALEKFKAVNDSLPESTFDFNPSNEVESCFWDYLRDNFRTAIDQVQNTVPFDLDFIREHMAIGPGSAQKADSRSMLTKLFKSRMSYANESLIPYYRAALSETGLWAEAEMLRFHRYGFEKVLGGRIFFAPKNAEISRTCCTEANLEMLIQKAIGAYYELILETVFKISLDTQPQINRRLAGIGSIDGSFGTIDLASASDSFGIHLFRKVQPNNSFLSWMVEQSRSSFLVLPDGEVMEPRMVSTMGNGFTFPLMTLLFACVVKSVYQLKEIHLHGPEGPNFSVFGDDIIVRREAYDFTISMLGKLGFQVNVLKSFNSGPFRESCGHDYFKGFNVRGVYIKSLETSADVFSAFNRLARWSARHSIPLDRTLRLLKSWCPTIWVPWTEADIAGLKGPMPPNVKVKEGIVYYRCFSPKPKRYLVDELHDGGIPAVICALAGHIKGLDNSITDRDLDDEGQVKPVIRAPERFTSIRGDRGVTRYKVVQSNAC